MNIHSSVPYRKGTVYATPFVSHYFTLHLLTRPAYLVERLSSTSNETFKPFRAQLPAQWTWHCGPTENQHRHLASRSR